LTKIIDRSTRRKWKDFNVISSNYNQDNTLNIRVHSAEKPNESCSNNSQLEDVYFVALKKDAVLC
jgi:hypothetical protein